MNKQLKELINKSKAIVFFGGAGVSTESGIPDFRSVDGLYHQKFRFPPEQILSHDFYKAHPEEFFAFYREKMLMLNALPNPAHIALAKLETEGKCKAVITQNIDGLHQKAGSKQVYELHGSVWRNYCEKCRSSFTPQEIKESEAIPRCSCGGRIKPDVVLYGESLDPIVLSGAIKQIQNADLLIVGGTSLSVYPAAGLLDYFSGEHLVLINREETPADQKADLLIHDSIGKALSDVAKEPCL